MNLPSLQGLENSGLVQSSGALGSAMLHLHTQRVTARKITSCAEKHHFKRTRVSIRSVRLFVAVVRGKPTHPWLL